MLKFIKQREKRCETRQNLYADTSNSGVSITVSQFIGQADKQEQVCEPKVMNLQFEIIDRDLEESLKQEVPRQPRGAMPVVWVPSVNHISMADESQ